MNWIPVIAVSSPLCRISHYYTRYMSPPSACFSRPPIVRGFAPLWPASVELHRDKYTRAHNTPKTVTEIPFLQLNITRNFRAKSNPHNHLRTLSKTNDDPLPPGVCSYVWQIKDLQRSGVYVLQIKDLPELMHSNHT